MLSGKTVNSKKTDTLIGANTEINGNIRSDASIHIEGKIVGDIECKGDVTVAVTGTAFSDITAQNILILGTVKGNVWLSGKLIIGASGKLIGDHTSTAIHIHKGGVVIGTRHITKDLELQ